MIWGYLYFRKPPYGPCLPMMVWYALPSTLLRSSPSVRNGTGNATCGDPWLETATIFSWAKVRWNISNPTDLGVINGNYPCPDNELESTGKLMDRIRVCLIRVWRNALPWFVEALSGPHTNTRAHFTPATKLCQATRTVMVLFLTASAATRALMFCMCHGTRFAESHVA